MEKLMILEQLLLFVGIGLWYGAACMLLELPITNLNTSVYFERFIRNVAFGFLVGGAVCFMFLGILALYRIGVYGNN